MFIYYKHGVKIVANQNKQQYSKLNTIDSIYFINLHDITLKNMESILTRENLKGAKSGKRGKGATLKK